MLLLRTPSSALSLRLTAAGFTLIETLVALTLFGILSVGVLGLVRGSLFHVRALERNEENRLRAEHVFAIIKRGVEDAERFLATPNIEVHDSSAGGRLLDRIMAEAGRRRTRRSIKPNSQLLSFRAVDILGAMSVIEYESLWRVESLLLCRSRSSAESLRRPEEIRTWIGLGADGFSEHRGSLEQSTAQDPRCAGSIYRVHLSQTSLQMFAGRDLWSHPPFALAEEAAPRLLVPVADSYTLYLSAERTVRLIAHNRPLHQPVEHGIEQLKAEVHRLGASLSALDVELVLKGNSPEKHDRFRRTFLFEQQPELLLDVAL